MIEEPTGLAILGGGTHDVAEVELTVIATEADGLSTPRDLEFNPDAPDQLWVVNRIEVMVVLHDAGTPTQKAESYGGPGAHHFFAQPSGLAFGAPLTMATIHETEDYTQGPNGTPKDFMGPTLHLTDLSWFDAGHQSHLDMLHNTPNGMGIAWHSGNTYWVFDGYHSAISLYLFNDDHGPGGADHSDGKVARYVQGEVQRVADVPSHMQLDRAANLLYLADTGNNRVAVLDPMSGTKGLPIYPNYDGGEQSYMNGADLWTVIDGLDHDMELPSGLVLADDMIWVGDNGTGRIHAFTLDGEQVDWLDTGLGPGALMGMDFDDQGRLHVCDAVQHRVLRIAPLAD